MITKSNEGGIQLQDPNMAQVHAKGSLERQLDPTSEFIGRLTKSQEAHPSSPDLKGLGPGWKEYQEHQATPKLWKHRKRAPQAKKGFRIRA